MALGIQALLALKLGALFPLQPGIANSTLHFLPNSKESRGATNAPAVWTVVAVLLNDFV